MSIRDGLIGRLTAERKRRGIGQGVLAALMGVSPSTLSGWECGTVNPTIDSLRSWAFTLRIPFPEELAAAESKCGTSAGYERHKRRGERKCGPCIAANTKAMQEYRANRRAQLQEAS